MAEHPLYIGSSSKERQSLSISRDLKIEERGMVVSCVSCTVLLHEFRESRVNS